MSKNGYSGLCSTCDGRATCTFPHHADRPTLFCGEFDWLWQHRMETAAKAMPPRQEVEARPIVEARTTSKYKGICATCDNQDGCTFPKSPAGVWHCEEFA